MNTKQKIKRVITLNSQYIKANSKLESLEAKRSLSNSNWDKLTESINKTEAKILKIDSEKSELEKSFTEEEFDLLCEVFDPCCEYEEFIGEW